MCSYGKQVLFYSNVNHGSMNSQLIFSFLNFAKFFIPLSLAKTRCVDQLKSVMMEVDNNDK